MPDLNISFTAASPAPVNGYLVKYWNVTTPSNVITVSPNPTSSPVTITGVPAGCYTGTIESACSSGQFSSPVSFNACSAASCLTGTTSATGNCASGQTSTFTLSAGNQATVSMTGFYYSGSGTRTITGALLDNSDSVIQSFTYTQTGAGAGTTAPSNYIINTAGTYKLQVNQVNCSLNGSGVATMTVGNCQAGNSYCVQITSENFTEASVDCPGQTDEYTVYTFTLKDDEGVTVNAPSNVDVTYDLTTLFGGGGGNTTTSTTTILAGNSSATATIYTVSALDGSPGCPCPCTTTASVDDLSFAASIAGPNTVNICPPAPLE